MGSLESGSGCRKGSRCPQPPGGRGLTEVAENNKQFAIVASDGPDAPVLVYATVPSAAEAERIGGALVDGRLAACVNILPAMTSLYVWQGRRHRDAEAVMIIKTRRALAERIVGEVRRLHPYDNPALVVLPIESGSADFLSWIVAETPPRAVP